MNFRYYIDEIEKVIKGLNPSDERCESIIKTFSELKTSLEECRERTVMRGDKEDSYDVAEWMGEWMADEVWVISVQVSTLLRGIRGRLYLDAAFRSIENFEHALADHKRAIRDHYTFTRWTWINCGLIWMNHIKKH